MTVLLFPPSCPSSLSQSYQALLVFLYNPFLLTYLFFLSVTDSVVMQILITFTQPYQLQDLTELILLLYIFFSFSTCFRKVKLLDFGLPVVHPRIEFTHLDTDRVHNCRPLSMGLSYKMSSRGKARNIFFFLCGFTLPSSFSQTKISQSYFCGDI